MKWETAATAIFARGILFVPILPTWHNYFANNSDAQKRYQGNAFCVIRTKIERQMYVYSKLFLGKQGNLTHHVLGFLIKTIIENII